MFPAGVLSSDPFKASSLAHQIRLLLTIVYTIYNYIYLLTDADGSVAEWLACWTQAQKGPGSNRGRDAVG